MGSPVFVGIQRILVAYDGSPHAEHAMNVALSMAGDMKAKLFVISVIRPPEPAESAEFHAVVDEGREKYEKSYIPIRELAKQKDIELETEVVVGHPAEQIVMEAEEKSIDLIVVGHRGKGLFERWLLGSVARVVIAYAHCAVMVVR